MIAIGCDKHLKEEMRMFILIPLLEVCFIWEMKWDCCQINGYSYILGSIAKQAEYYIFVQPVIKICGFPGNMIVEEALGEKK